MHQEPSISHTHIYSFVNARNNIFLVSCSSGCLLSGPSVSRVHLAIWFPIWSSVLPVFAIRCPVGQPSSSPYLPCDFLLAVRLVVVICYLISDWPSILSGAASRDIWLYFEYQYYSYLIPVFLLAVSLILNWYLISYVLLNLPASWHLVWYWLSVLPSCFHIDCEFYHHLIHVFFLVLVVIYFSYRGSCFGHRGADKDRTEGNSKPPICYPHRLTIMVWQSTSDSQQSRFDLLVVDGGAIPSPHTHTHARTHRKTCTHMHAYTQNKNKPDPPTSNTHTHTHTWKKHNYTRKTKSEWQRKIERCT